MEQKWKTSALSDISAHKACAGYSELAARAKTKVDALALYKRIIDWCLENNSPSVDLLRQYRQDCAYNGIFIDRHFDGELLTDSPVYVFHNCSGTIHVGLNVKRRIIPMLYFANGCDMTVVGEGPSKVRVPLYVFGKNRIEAEENGSMEPVINRK